MDISSWLLCCLNWHRGSLMYKPENEDLTTHPSFKFCNSFADLRRRETMQGTLALFGEYPMASTRNVTAMTRMEDTLMTILCSKNHGHPLNKESGDKLLSSSPH